MTQSDPPQHDSSPPSGVFGRSLRWSASRGVRLLRQGLFLLAAVLITILVVRTIDAERGPPLERWHTFVPKELSPREMDRSDWKAWLAAEDRLMRSVAEEVTATLEPEHRVPTNRYARESPMHPARFATDWNRSYVLEPTRVDASGQPLGAVVLVHGLTDAPYSLRHVARLYAERGFVAVGLRLPGHGTVPAGLVGVDRDDWMAAVRLAVREARRRAPERPLHIVGYSLGGALALSYALDAAERSALARPDRIILFSPMVGVTRFARFAGIAGWPALLPRFAKAAWLDIVPEFNPFKYNSFPVNAARQTHSISIELQSRLARLARSGESIAPVLCFQSVLDATVSTPAVLGGLFAQLPENGSELVLADIDRSGPFAGILRPHVLSEAERIAPAPPLSYRLAILESDPDAERVGAVRARVYEAGATAPRLVPLGISFPREIFSLSHVALPFPLDDPLYGTNPTSEESFGIALGTLVARGERGALIVPVDTLQRINANPFFPSVLERIAAGIDDPAPVIAGGARRVGPAAGSGAGRHPKDLPQAPSSGVHAP
jgi:alpha-beta hydrolase superfamily lysophospholipase